MAPCSFYAVTNAGAPRGAPVVVLLPGLGGNALAWPHAFMDGLARGMPARVVLATTYAEPFGATMADVARAVWTSLAGLPPSLWSLATPTVLIGYSMGGFVAQEMVSDAPLGSWVPGVVLLSTGTPSSRRLPVPMNELLAVAVGVASHSPAKLATLFPDEWLAAVTLPTLRALRSTLAMGRVSPETRAAEYATVVRYLLGGGTGTFRVPRGTATLVLHGQDDRLLLASAARAGAAALSNATVVVVPRAGHGLLFQDMASVLGTIVAWWRTVDATARPPTPYDAYPTPVTADKPSFVVAAAVTQN